VAAINVDGIAHFARFRDLFAVGGELSSLGDSLGRVAARLGLRVSEPPALFSRPNAFAMSDQAVFAEAGIPAVLVNEGFDWHDHTPREAMVRAIDWGMNVYHSPFDDLAQVLDFDAIEQHAQVLQALILELTEAQSPPRWRDGTHYVLAQLRARAEGR
jgi:Zn-dependent M28 family amino/carboxypeptidase